MAYVYVLNGRARFTAFQLARDAVTFGQREDADVVIKDPWISWTHARVLREGSGFAIEDLGSTNGTYVNCVRVKRRPLDDDDVIFLGRTHLLFVASARFPSAPPPMASQSRDPAVERGTSTDRLRLRQPRPRTAVLPFQSHEELPGLSSSGSRDGIEAIEFRGPLEDFGPIDELDEVASEPDTDGFLPPPPPLAGAEDAISTRAGFGGGSVEIDVADLVDSSGDALAASGGGGADSTADVPSREEDGAPGDPDGEPVGGFASSDEIDPIGARDAEIERLRGALAAREHEIRRLREELTRLKEQYLDLES